MGVQLSGCGHYDIIRCEMVAGLVYLLVSCLFVLHSPVAGEKLQFNYTKCPHPQEMQSDLARNSFNISKFVGNYYELALHDYTQFPVCFKGPRCMTSHKVYDPSLKQINDSFHLDCLGLNYGFTFHFKLTDVRGHFNGTASVFPEILFPDTVVDFKEGEDGLYEWVIEVQCDEKFDHVWFVGINWYSRLNDTSQEYVDGLLNAARERGLGVYMDGGTGVYRVPQDGC